MKLFSTLLVLLTCLSCEEVLVPKPKAFFSLDYKKASYSESHGEFPFLFEKNKLTQISISKKQNNQEGFILHYPTLKASIFIALALFYFNCLHHSIGNRLGKVHMQKTVF